jgi:hypothetical protein
MDKEILMFKVLARQATPADLIKWEELLRNEDTRNKFESVQFLNNQNLESGRIESIHSSRDGFNAIKQIIHARNQSKRRRGNAFLLLVMAVFILCIQYFIFNTDSTSKNATKMLRFNHVALSEVIPILENEFNVTISVSENSLSCYFTGAFYHNSSSEAVRLIAQSLEMQYQQIKENRFTLTSGRCLQERVRS